MNRSAVRIDPARAAALIELPTPFHPLLAEKLAQEKLRLEQKKQKNLPENGWGPFLTAIGRRELRIRDAILRAAEARGYMICHREDSLFGMWFVIDGERIDWEFRERYHYRSPRPAELKSDPQKRRQTNVAEPSGYLILTIKAVYAPKQDVTERHGRLFETRIEELLHKFEAKAAHAVSRRNWWEERERARYERGERELRLRTLEDREDDRWRGLCDMAAAWRRANDLRAFVDIVAARVSELDKRPVRADLWLGWARRRIDSLDPSCRDARAVYDAVVRNPLLRESGMSPDSPAFDGPAFDEP